jgi:hypothetical protein
MASIYQLPGKAIIGVPDDGTNAKHNLPERSPNGVRMITDKTVQATATTSIIHQNSTSYSFAIYKTVGRIG